MKKIIKVMILSLIIVSANNIKAQEMIFLGQGIGDQVRLFWIPKLGWPKNLEGVNLKRRTNGEEWVLLNNSMIVPATDLDKSLNNIGLSSNSLETIIRKRASLIQSGRLNAIAQDEFKQLMADENNVKGVSMLLNSDFDISLMAGFGYVDAVVPEITGVYEYGLFLVDPTVEHDQPVATFEWHYGTNPQIEISMEGSVKTNKSRKTVELTWKVDVQDYKNYSVLNGFNVYRKLKNAEFTKLSENAIWISLKEKSSTLYYKDTDVDLSKEYVYAAAPNTIFNTAGQFSEVKLEPAVNIPEMTPPILENPRYEQSQLLLNWEFNVENEPFIRGFYVQKKNNEGNIFSNISEMLPPYTRAFSYTELSSPDDAHYHFKVVAVKVDEMELWSNRKIYLHKKNTKPTAPQNLSGTVERNATDIKVKLEWEKPIINGNEVTAYYLYSSHPNSDKVIKDNSLGKITTESVEYVIHKNSSARYYFAISAVNDNYEESTLSDKISVLIPSKSLPFIDVWPVQQQENVITLDWKYSADIADLIGFRLYQNGELVADETVISKTSRQWISSGLEQGNYSFEIIALTESGIESKKSKPRTFIVK